jgi:hypothetical protein
MERDLSENFFDEPIPQSIISKMDTVVSEIFMIEQFTQT